MRNTLLGLTGFAELAALPGTGSGYVIGAAIPWSEIDVVPMPGE